MKGDQPVSQKSIRETASTLHEYGLPFFIDACRYAENAYFIKLHEAGHGNKSTLEIAREIFGLVEATIPIVEPPGGHAVYLDALRFLPHMPRGHLPGQALVAGLYLQGGNRTSEIGAVMFAKEDAETGETIYPEMDLVRLAIPRRVYAQSHLDYG